MPAKAYDYIVECKPPDYKLVNLVSQIMLFLSLVVFGSSSYLSSISARSVSLYVIMTGILAWLIYSNRRQRKGVPTYYRIALTLAAIGWGMQPDHWKWVSVVFVIAAIMERQVKFPVEYAFDEKQVVFNSLPKRYYNWKDISNVVLKDGILTIDFRNNKLIQKEINEHISGRLEQDFNEFCRQCLAATRSAA
ncbi:MAG TPA: hypothetical protein VF408_10315 [Sediminibacterium sp.]|jgi:hypothetical protein